MEASQKWNILLLRFAFLIGAELETCTQVMKAVNH